MFKSKKFLTLHVFASISLELLLFGPQAFATNIIGQPDFMNPVPPPCPPSIQTSWGNFSGGSQPSNGNSGSSHTGNDLNGGGGQPYQAPPMSQYTFGDQSNSNSVALPNNLPTPYEAPKFLSLPATPNLFAPQNPVPQGVDMQGMAFELLWVAQSFDNYYGSTQVNKVNSVASSQNSLLDQDQFNARHDQLRSSADVDRLINDLEALTTEFNSKSRQLDSINHETLKTFNDNQKSPHRQIRDLNQAGFDKYYKSYAEVSKYVVEIWGWAKTSINQLKDRKKHIGVSEREQRIQDAVDRATADARNRLEQARQATNNRRVEIRELQRIRANVNSAQIQQTHVERIVSEVNETLPRMTAQMEQAAADYIRGQLQSSQELAQTGVDIATSGASDSVIRIVSGFAVDTVVSIQSFTSGFVGGAYQGLLTSAQVASAIFSNPTLVTNLSVGIMNTITAGPSAVAGAVHDAFQHVANEVWEFQVAMAGSADEQGCALGHFGSNVVIAMASAEVVGPARAALNKIGRAMEGSQPLSRALNQRIGNAAELAPELSTLDELIPGLNRPFRGPNPAFPANERVIQELKSSRFADLMNHPSVDCSELAENLYRAAGNEGKIIEVTTNRPIHLNVLERGRETGPRYEYHQAYTDGRYIYDPRAHLGPIPRGDWTRMIEKLNPEGVSFRDVNL